MAYKIVSTSLTLHDIAKTGKTKYWRNHVLQDGTKWATQSESWQDAGAHIFSEPYEVKAKNIGKVNEIPPREQAYKEGAADLQKKVDKGYAMPGETSTVLSQPMLAQKFKERGDKLTWPCYVQPKLNGMRMLFDGQKAWSRGGKPILPEVIEHLTFDTGGCILDGELILPGNRLLQNTMTAAKKFRPDLSPQLTYVVYDIVEPSQRFSQRSNSLAKLKNLPDNVILCETQSVEDFDQVMSWHKKFTAAGYEGTMIRDDSGGYEVGHRSNQLQKLKDFVDDEFPIVSIREGDGRFRGAAVVTCQVPNGKVFEVVPEGPMSYKQKLFQDRDSLIGRLLTVRYQELSQDGIPLFPVGVTMREDL